MYGLLQYLTGIEYNAIDAVVVNYSVALISIAVLASIITCRR